MKVWQIARRLLWQNRWLFLFLILWPYAMAAIFFVPGAGPGSGGVLLILHEECFYGLALVAFTGSVQLGNEQRSRRIAAVLSRAVSRQEYLFALLCATWIPLALYTVSFLVSGAILFAQADAPLGILPAMALALLLLGLWVATASLFFSTWLPSWLASIATLALLGATLLMAGSRAGWTISTGEAFIAILAAGAFFWAAAIIFERRDLKMKGE